MHAAATCNHKRKTPAPRGVSMRRRRRDHVRTHILVGLLDQRCQQKQQRAYEHAVGATVWPERPVQCAALHQSERLSVSGCSQGTSHEATRQAHREESGATALRGVRSHGLALFASCVRRAPTGNLDATTAAKVRSDTQHYCRPNFTDSDAPGRPTNPVPTCAQRQPTLHHPALFSPPLALVLFPTSHGRTECAWTCMLW